jgi:glyoxylase-like metal-dependent hydrolase (beta-lactamase superfamily II)
MAVTKGSRWRDRLGGREDAGALLGTRGSLAKPGPNTLRHGGNTSCVQVVTESGLLLVIDCGTGGHELGQALLRDAEQPLRGHMLISHTHWDHIRASPSLPPSSPRADSGTSMRRKALASRCARRWPARWNIPIFR